MNPSIGVIQREELPSCIAPGTIASTELFASTLAWRFAPRTITVSRAELALAWEAPAEVNHFHSAPRIEMFPTMTVQERYMAAGVSKEATHAPLPGTSYSEDEASALFERLFSRRVRVAAFNLPQAPHPRDPAILGGRAMESSPRAGVVERVTPRATVIEKAATPAEPVITTSPSAREAGWGSPPAFQEVAKPVNLPAPEIKRVAEQVMREIDHRIIARRERMGRR